VKRRLKDAAVELGVKVRSSRTDEKQRTLVWKKTTRRVAPAPVTAGSCAERRV
jgi:hypothetical protein